MRINGCGWVLLRVLISKSNLLSEERGIEGRNNEEQVFIIFLCFFRLHSNFMHLQVKVLRAVFHVHWKVENASKSRRVSSNRADN